MSGNGFIFWAWNWDPWTLAICATALGWYGMLCSWKFRAQSIFFFVGLALIFLALASPLDFLARGYLFSAHMLQHLLLVMIAPPLCLLGLPAPRLLSVQDPRFAWLKKPWIAWSCGLGVMCFWHLPLFCDAAIYYPDVHGLQTFSLLAMGGLFWRPIVGPRLEDRLAPLLGVLYLFSACIGCTLLGVWISFAPLGICPIFIRQEDPLGLRAMIRGGCGLSLGADQQIGGLLMWVPACLVYLGAILFLLLRYYREKGPSHA